MKVRICSKERSFSVLLPTRMVFSRGFLQFGLRIGRKYSDAVPEIPPEAVDALCGEIRRIKNQCGSWELVDIRSADGEQVKVVL
ncbi:MAG: hypothetical protein J6L24_07750 [Oscillospiraceae bacterium]|nr:hypothetical protein [Oscillospiraceae bacterium]